MIIDFHTHIFSDDVKRRPDYYASLCHWFAELYPPDKRKLATVEDLVAEMETCGVDKSVICGFGWSEHGLCVEANDYYLDAIKRHPGKVIAFASINPNAGEKAGQEIDRCANGGMLGIGELNPDGQGFSLDDSTVMGPIVEAAMAHNLPLLVHSSEPLGHNYRGKGTNRPEVIFRFLSKFPQVKLVCAHWGGGLPFYELMPEVRQACANIYYDSAASPFLYRPEVFSAVVRLVGSRRVLFATDYPLLRQKRVLDYLAESGLAGRELEDILGHNAAQLLGFGREAG